jgi:putative NADPH-quinone reductase
VEWRFCRGFCEKRGAERGFLRGKRYMFVVSCGQRENTFPAAFFMQGFVYYFPILGGWVIG